MRRIAAGLTLFLAACGAPGPRVVAVAGDSVVLLTPTPDHLPFDPRAARLRAAVAELAEIAGHPVRIELDAALADDSVRGFQDQLVEAVETVARDLVDLREHDAEAFAWAAPIARTIACAYDPKASTESVRLDDGAKTVRVVAPSHRYALVAPASVRRALEGAYERHVGEKYARAAPESLAPDERAGFFRWLDEARPMNADGVGGEGLSEGRASRILTVLRLERVVGASDAGLAKGIRAWLLAQRDYFVGLYLHHPEAVRASPSGSPFHEAEAAYVAWFGRELDPRRKADAAPAAGFCEVDALAKNGNRAGSCRVLRR